MTEHAVSEVPIGKVLVFQLPSRDLSLALSQEWSFFEAGGLGVWLEVRKVRARLPQSWGPQDKTVFLPAKVAGAVRLRE